MSANGPKSPVMRGTKPEAARSAPVRHAIRLSIGDAVIGRAEGRDHREAAAAARRLAGFADHTDVQFAVRDLDTGEFVDVDAAEIMAAPQDDGATDAGADADADADAAAAAEKRAREQAALAALLPGGGPPAPAPEAEAAGEDAGES